MTGGETLALPPPFGVFDRSLTFTRGIVPGAETSILSMKRPAVTVKTRTRQKKHTHTDMTQRNSILLVHKNQRNWLYSCEKTGNTFFFVFLDPIYYLHITLAHPPSNCSDPG